MQYVLLLGEILFSGVFGVLCLYLAMRRLQEDSAAETRGLPEIQEDHLGQHWRIIALLLFANIVVACFMYGFYRDTILNVGNTLLLCAVLWVCAWADWKQKLIPNKVLLLGLLARCLMLTAELFIAPYDVLYDLLRSGIAGAALFAASFLCRLISSKAIGWGDVKLLVLMGFCLGADRVWSCVFCSMIIAFFYSVGLLLTKRANLKSEIPFAPILLAGTVMASILTSV